MGLGWAGAYGAAGAAKGLRQLMLERIEAEERAKADKQREFENRLNTRKLDQNDELTRLRLAEMASTAAGAREDRQINLANAIGDQLPAGSELAPTDEAVSLLRKGGRGSLLQEQNTLPSQQTAGGMTMPGAAEPSAVAQTQASAPKLRGYLKLPSAKQQQDQAAREDKIADNARQDKATDATIQARIDGLNQAAERLRMQGEVNAARILQMQAQAEASQARAAATNAKAGGNGPSPYAAERNIRNKESVAALLKKVSPYTTGVGSLLSFFPGTKATDFEEELKTLKANIGFGELAAMREASKTGGALGQVSDREIELLTAALGALSTRQSPKQFAEQLNKVQASIERWEKASGAKPSTAPTRKVYDINGKEVTDAP